MAIKESELDKALHDLKHKNPIINLVETSEKTFELAHATTKGDKDFHKSVMGKLDDLEAAVGLYGDEIVKSLTQRTSALTDGSYAEINGDMLMYLKTLEENTFESSLVSKKGYNDLVDAELMSASMLEKIWHDNQEGWLSVMTIADVMQGIEKQRALDADKAKVVAVKPQKDPAKLDNANKPGTLLDKILDWVGAPFMMAGGLLKKSVGKIVDWLMYPFIYAKKFIRVMGKKYARKIMGAVGKLFSPIVQMFTKLTTKFPLLGKLTKVLKFGGKLLGKFIQPILSLFDFFSGFGNASEIIGKAEDQLDWLDKTFAGLSEVLSGLTFGIIDAKKFYKWIFSDEGIFGKIKEFGQYIYDALPAGLKKAISTTMDFLGSFFTEAFKAIDIPLKSVGIDIVGIVQKVITTISDFVASYLKESVMGSAINKLKSWFGGGAKKIGDTLDEHSNEARMRMEQNMKSVDTTRSGTVLSSKSVGRELPTDVSAMTLKKEMAMMQRISGQKPVTVIQQSSSPTNFVEQRQTSLDLDLQYQLTGM